jgi:hypothetical protein
MKWNLVEPIGKIYSQGLYRNLFQNFLSFISFSMHFRSLYIFLKFLNLVFLNKKIGTVLGRVSAQR